MTTVPTPHEHEEESSSAASSPIIDGHTTEMARLLSQHWLVSQLLGGPVPSSLRLAPNSRILDVGCGAGRWCYEMARLYPATQIIGIDNSPSMIEMAQQLIRDRGERVTFLVEDMHALVGEPFLTGSFDLINLRFLAGDVSFQQYPLLVQSLGQFCREDGYLLLTEAELPATNSQACDYLESMLLAALIEAKRAFSPGYRLALGIFAWLEQWVREASYTIIAYSNFVLTVTPEQPELHRIFARQFRLLGQRVRPLLLETGVATTTIFEDVFARALKEIHAPDFRATCPIQVVAGVKL